MIMLEHRPSGEFDLIRLTGRLGGDDVGDVSARLVDILDRGPGIVHLDLGALSFLDTGGLAAVISLFKRARRRGGDVILYDVNARVRALLELSRLHEIFEIRESAAHASSTPPALASMSRSSN